MAGSTAERFNKTNILVATTNHVSPYQDHDSAARLDMMLAGDASTSYEFIWGATQRIPKLGSRTENWPLVRIYEETQQPTRWVVRR